MGLERSLIRKQNKTSYDCILLRSTNKALRMLQHAAGQARAACLLGKSSNIQRRNLLSVPIKQRLRPMPCNLLDFFSLREPALPTRRHIHRRGAAHARRACSAHRNSVVGSASGRQAGTRDGRRGWVDGSTRTLHPTRLPIHASIHPSLIDTQLETLCTSGCESSPRRHTRGGEATGGHLACCMHAFCRWPSEHGAHAPERAKRNDRRGVARGHGKKPGKVAGRFGARAYHSVGDWPGPGAGAQFPAGDGVDDPVPDAGNGRRAPQASCGISLLEGTELRERGLPRMA
jgi:hypothetical protein